MTASLGLGTYRCRDVARAAAMAAAAGADWIDTAPNYAQGQAERALAPVLARHPELKVSTKVGFLAPGSRGLALRAGVVAAGTAEAGHCLAPRYIGWQVECNRRTLGRTPDLVFVHNPEHGCSREAITDRLYLAFLTLEKACQAGLIRGYGVATWSGFSSGLFDVPLLLELASKAGGPQHHLRAIQLPLSLVNLAPIAQALDGVGVLADAVAAELEVFASAPLHGGAVPGLVTPELAELIRSGSTPAGAGLAVVASAPGVRRLLVSTDQPQHWSEATTVIGQPPVPLDTLRKVTDVLGT
ncbi:aldo/keto reductase [Streptomyces spiramyceticus]|uniref:aldo/keto reductase n=1 Tax=Streptomyces spiramyceticus TaxID=299717 RepID=UPI00237A578A|nr:aldo/keto reductase [Streptomyces spiramyceticus]